MKLDWFGRYRDISASLIYFSNSFKLPINKKADFDHDIALSVSEWQVLETVIEFADDNKKMADLAARLCMPQSTLTVAAKTLLRYDLIEKYHLEGNRKNVILKPSEKGIALYKKSCEQRVTAVFSKFFEQLKPLSDEQLAIVTNAIYTLSNALISDQDSHEEIKTRLVRIE